MAGTVLVAGALLAAGPAPAEELSGSVTLYGWLPWADADVTTGRGELSSSISGGDVLDALDFAFMASGDVQYGRFGLLLDLVYAKLSDEGTLAGPLGSTAKTSLKETLFTSAVTYRVVRRDAAVLDAFAGARVVNVDTDVTVTGGGPIGAVARAGADVTWVDPIIGLRGELAITDKLSATALADIGGFGAGSDFSWEVFAGLNYAITERFSGRLGFRYISIDYSKDGREFDVDFYGPALGVSVNF